MRRSVLVPATALVSTFLLGACGGDVAGTAPEPGPTSAAAGSGGVAPAPGAPRSATATSTGVGAGGAARVGDPCDLVARVRLEEALGAQLGVPRSTDSGAVKACDYLVPAGSDVSLQLRVQRDASAAEFATGQATVALGRPTSPVPSLGEQAYAAALPGGGQLVVALEGTRQVLVSTTGARVTRAGAVAVARLALPALLAQPG